MHYPTFAKDEFTKGWPPGSLTSLHASNPRSFDLNELSKLTGMDVLEFWPDGPLDYASATGDQTLLNLISEQHQYDLSHDQLLLTVGAQEAIFMVMQGLLQPQDHVIGFSPCFEPLVTEAKMTGASVTTIPLQAEQGWGIDWASLEKAFLPNTKLLVINFPHNPTGTHISTADLNRLIDLCTEHDCWLFSDEVFRGLEHKPEHRIDAAVARYNKGISLGVMSKSLALPGVRLGWLAMQDRKLLGACLNIKKHLSICPSALDVSVCQALMPYAESLWTRSQQVLNQGKRELAAVVNSTHGMHWTPPLGGATGFVELDSLDGVEFATQLANNHRLLVIPGTGFMTTVNGFRITIGNESLNHHYTVLTPPNSG